VLGVVMFIVAAAATIGLLVAVVVLDFVKVSEDISANVVVVFILAIVYSPILITV